MTLVTLRELERSEFREAALVLARAMCDNPINLRAFRIKDRSHRIAALYRFFIPVVRGVAQRGQIVGAFRDDTLLGVCGMARPGLCQPTAFEKLRFVPALAGSRLDRLLQVVRWTGEWARHDPEESHWHLGPVAVDPSAQGKGVGGAMLSAFCQSMDTLGASSYLETDKPANLQFYQRFGFTIVANTDVLGVPNWFMLRSPATLPE